MIRIPLLTTSIMKCHKGLWDGYQGAKKNMESSSMCLLAHVLYFHPVEDHLVISDIVD